MSDPFDVLRDELVRAAARAPARASRWRRWWLERRRHPLVLVAAVLVLSGSAAAAVVSLTSKPSAPLAGRVPPTHAKPQSQREPLSVAGDRYTITVAPTLLAGSAGWCSTLSYTDHGKLVEGSGNCGGGGSFPTAGLPLFGNPGYALYAAGSTPTGDRVNYILTGPGVAAVRIGAKTTITARADPGLPAGDKAAVFFLPAGSPPVVIPLPGAPPVVTIPPPPGTSGSRPKLIHALALVPLDRAGHPIAITAQDGGPSLPNRFWQSPTRPARGSCQITNRRLQGLGARWGHVISRIAPVPGVQGAALLSCVDTEYYFHNWPLQAAILLDARAPGSPPGALPGAKPVPAHPGIVNVGAIGQFPGDLAITARRVGNAWLVVQGGRDVKQRLQVLDVLALKRIKLDRRNG